MDWDAALDGCCKALARTVNADKVITMRQAAITDAVTRLFDATMHKDDYGGKLCYYTPTEMEPTFENMWDYEWPTDFPPAS